MQEGIKASKLGTMPVAKLLLTTGLPMIVSMVLQAVYNIVDSAFVSNMSGNGEQALNALTLAFPVQMLLVAVGIGTGVGANALLSKSLGQGDGEKAGKVAGNAFCLGIVIFALFLLFGFFGVPAYIASQTADSLIREMATEYLRICCVFSAGIVFFSIYEKLLQATGRSLFSTIAQIAGAATNIVLDPIMIYGWLGCPEMGVAGAAYATVIGQCVSFLLAFSFHLLFNKEIKNGFRYLKPEWKIVKGIYAVGLPAIIAQALMSVMTYGMNLILGGIGDEYVTAYGLYYKIQQFVLFAAFGLRDAITPVVSYNFGMGDKRRVREGIRYGLLYTLALMALGTAVLEIFALPLTGIFRLSGRTQELCMSAMRVISVSFLFAGANIALQGVFQAIECGASSLAVSLGRQLVFVLPVAFGLAAVVKAGAAGAWLVWLAFPVGELITAALACLLMRRAFYGKIAPMEERGRGEIGERAADSV